MSVSKSNLIRHHILITGELEVTNSKYATKLLINPETTELDAFRARLYMSLIASLMTTSPYDHTNISSYNFTRLHNASNSSSQSFSQVGSMDSYSMESDFLNDTDSKTLDDLRDYAMVLSVNGSLNYVHYFS